MVRIICKSNKVIEIIHKEGCRMAQDFLSSLDTRIKNSIKLACKRAKDNGRLTVMSKDL